MPDVLNQIAVAIWFFVPAGVANASPVFFAKLPGLRTLEAPVDFGYTWRGTRLLGDHKTWRGVIGGTLVGGLVALLSMPLIYDASPLHYFVLGCLLGFGALLGDALKSFVKRQIGVPSGNAWFPFDQLGYIIGACLLSALLVQLTPVQYASILLFWFAAHLIASYIGYLLKLKDKPI